MAQTRQKILVAIVFIIALAALIASLNISPYQPDTSVFNASNNSPTSNNTQANTQQTPHNPNNKQADNNPFNTSQTNPNNTANANNPHFPPGFPEPLPPLDLEKLEHNDDLIAQGDAIVSEMNTLIAGLDLPKIKLSASEQAELTNQRQIQQARLKDIKTQLETLEQNLSGDLP